MKSFNPVMFYKLCVKLNDNIEYERLYAILSKYKNNIINCNSNNTRRYSKTLHLKLVFILSKTMCLRRQYSGARSLLTAMIDKFDDIHCKNSLVFKILQINIAVKHLDEYNKSITLLTHNDSVEFKKELRFTEFCYNVKTNNYSKINDTHETYKFIMSYINEKSSELLFTLERFALNWTNKMLLEYTTKEVSYYNVHNKIQIDNNYGPHEGVNIALISRDFWNRPTGQLLNQFFNHIGNTTSTFNYHLIQLGHFKDDLIYKNLNQNANSFTQIEYQLEIIKIMKEKKIDIIIDLMGLMYNNVLNVMSLKLAKIQLAWLSYPSTLGMAEIDYMVADIHTIPKKQQDGYIEKILYMPECYQINDDRLSYTEFRKYTFTDKEVIIPEHKKGKVFVGFLNSAYKIDFYTLGTWARAFKQCPDAVLVILQCSKQSVSNIAHTWVHVLNMPLEQLQVWPYLQKEKYLERTRRHLDFCVDSIYCNSHTTGSDILSTGTPLVTLSHKTFAGQVAKSLLQTIHCPELIAKNRKTYIKKIIKLANDAEYRSAITKKVQYNIKKYNLFNSGRYFQHFMSGLETVWDNHLKGIKEHIYIDTIEEYTTFEISYAAESTLALNIVCKCSTCKLLIDDCHLEILMNKPSSEIWINGEMISLDIISTLDIFPDGSSESPYIVTLTPLEASQTSVSLNNILIWTGVAQFKNIQCNGTINVLPE